MGLRLEGFGFGFCCGRLDLDGLRSGTGTKLTMESRSTKKPSLKLVYTPSKTLQQPKEALNKAKSKSLLEVR